VLRPLAAIVLRPLAAIVLGEIVQEMSLGFSIQCYKKFKKSYDTFFHFHRMTY
jgi:hypothetical protein